MAERDTLLSTLPDDVRDDVAELYTDKATQDPRDIVAELHRRGRIDAGQLRGAVLQLEAQLRIRRVKERPPESLEPTVLGPLGEGAMGEVMLARDEGLNRIIALKRLHPDHANHKGLLRRFYTEAQVTAQLDHPAIVPIHGIYPGKDGSLAYGMKLVRGQTLEDYLETAMAQEKSGRVDEAHHLQARLERFLHVCDALAYAHTKGVLHRDLKPENIMVGAFGEVMVMDWGIAKLLEGTNVEVIDVETGQSRQASATRVGRVVGTPRYMSPEQAAGQNDIIDTQADQYALGLILQELVTFTPGCPTKVTLEQALARATKAQRQPMVAAAGASPPRELVAIVDKACALAPAGRYASVNDLAEDIRRYLRDEPVLAKRDSILQRLGRFLSRHRTATLFMIMALMIALLVTSGVLASAGLAAHEYRRYVTAGREERLAEVMSNTNDGAARIDEELAHVEALVVGLSFATERGMLDKEAIELGGKNLLDGPKGGQASKLYGGRIAADVPSFSVPGRKNGDVSEAMKEDLARMIALGPQMGRVLGDSPGRSRDVMARKDLTRAVAKGVPVRWVRIGTTDGIVATTPGMSSAEFGKDGRKERWYHDARDTSRAQWGHPTVDAVLSELVLTVSHPAYSRKGDLVAVVSADLSLDEVIHLMRADSHATNAWILDEEGRVLASRELRNAKAYEPPPFPSKAVFEDIQENTKTFQVRQGQVYSWSRLTTVPGWTFVSLQDL